VKETARAKQAWADYLALPNRSLETLLERYRTATKPPTRRLKTLADWSRFLGWQARLSTIAQNEAAAVIARESAARAALQAEGIRSRHNRLVALNDRAERMFRVIAERGDADEFKDVPGGTTGLMVRSWKVAGGTAYVEFAVDTGLLAELRAHEKQAAQELGEWTERNEIRGSREAPLAVEHIGSVELRTAELAFLSALGLKPGRVVDDEGDNHSPDAGPDSIPSIPVSIPLSNGSKPSPTGGEG
jgi:hypothetical protein